MKGPNWYYNMITRTMLSLKSQKYAKQTSDPFCLFFLGQQDGPVGKSIAVKPQWWNKNWRVAWYAPKLLKVMTTASLFPLLPRNTYLQKPAKRLLDGFGVLWFYTTHQLRTLGFPSFQVGVSGVTVISIRYFLFEKVLKIFPKTKFKTEKKNEVILLTVEKSE